MIQNWNFLLKNMYLQINSQWVMIFIFIDKLKCILYNLMTWKMQFIKLIFELNLFQSKYISDIT